MVRTISNSADVRKCRLSFRNSNCKCLVTSLSLSASKGLKNLPTPLFTPTMRHFRLTGQQGQRGQWNGAEGILRRWEQHGSHHRHCRAQHPWSCHSHTGSAQPAWRCTGQGLRGSQKRSVCVSTKIVEKKKR